MQLYLLSNPVILCSLILVLKYLSHGGLELFVADLAVAVLVYLLDNVSPQIA
jgi:hypothetical protein